MLTPSPVTEYALDVLAGRIVAGPLVRAACRRHMRDLEREDLWFDQAEYDRVCVRFFEGRLRLSEGQFEGEPFRLHPSQRFILGSIFCWRRVVVDEPDPRRWPRRFRRAYIEEAKGSGKSPLIGGVGLFGMMYDNEPGAQIYSAAADRNQAEILFRDAVKMAQASPEMRDEITFSGNQKIFNMAALGRRQMGSFFRPLARTAATSGSGLRPHMALCDELHEHPSRDTLDLLERGFKFRRNPLLVMITNSGTDRRSVCWEEREHARAVVEGEVEDDTTFGYICALDDGDDPLEDPSCWVKANPLLGVTITEEYLAGVVQQAKMIPGKRNGILRLHFCRWTSSETAWIPRETWEACEDPSLRLEDMEGRSCRAGLDLASRKDLVGLALCFDDGETEAGESRYVLWVHGYTPGATMAQRARDDRAPYEEWAAAGHITATQGPTIRFPQVVADLERHSQDFDVQAVAYDRYLITRFSEDMADMGVSLPLVEHPQGFARRRDTDLWMPGSIDFLEELILNRRLRVFVNPALRSAVSGATFVSSPAGLRRFAKESATQRIDLLVAAAMAVGASYSEAAEGGESVYERLARERIERQGGGEAAVRPARREWDDDDDDL